MFPLGSVVFPYTAIPLRVFEPRYQVMLDNVMAGDCTFGTVLIERGVEVGGGDARFPLGTLVKVAAMSEPGAEGGRTIVVAGMSRILVTQWLPDDPHPVAVVEDQPDPEEPIDAYLEPALCELRRVLALASELGADVSGVSLDLAEHSVAASYQLAALCPITALDSHRLLAAPGPGQRLQMATEFLSDQATLLQAELASQ